MFLRLSPAIIASISASSRHGVARTATAKDWADPSMTRTIIPAKDAVAGLNRTATPATGGIIWVRDPQPFASHRRVVICEAGDIAAAAQSDKLARAAAAKEGL